MADTYDGTILTMRQKNPASLTNGEIFRSREASAPKRESIFMWDPTPYVGPLYDNAGTPEVPQYVGFAPTSDPDGSHTGVWRWVDPPAGNIDAERIYGIAAGRYVPGAADFPASEALAVNNARQFQRMIDEVLLANASPRFSTDPDPTPQNPDPGPGDGDGWVILFPPGDIHLKPDNGVPFLFNRKTEVTSTAKACDYPQTEAQERVTVAGRITLQGHGLSTRLIYEGTPIEHAFRVGPLPNSETSQGSEETHGSGCVLLHIGGFVLRGLELAAATSPGYAVLRLAQARGENLLQNVKVSQYGDGDGINATQVIFSQFIQVVVQRHAEATESYSGRGFWMHTDDFPYIISGQTIISRLSVFGRFAEGITFGENPEGSPRLLGSISAQFLNPEVCRDGLVFGRGAVNIDVSVVWVEANSRCGVRFYNGAKHITLRQVYTFNARPEVGIPFEGDVVFGKPGSPNDAEENSYASISVEKIFQHFIYGPAARLHYASGAVNRDIAIREVFVGFPFDPPSFAGELFGGGPDWMSSSLSGTITPIAEAVVQLDDGTYDGLVVERVQPYSDFAGLPNNTNGVPVLLINRPHLVARIVYSGPYDAQYAYGIYETHGPTVARLGITHDDDYTIKHNDPMYHRVTVDGDDIKITLPRIKRQGLVAANDREGMEFHIMWTGGTGLAVEIRGVQGVPPADQELIRSQAQPGGSGSIYLLSAYEYVRVRAVSEGGSRFWEVIDKS